MLLFTAYNLCKVKKNPQMQFSEGFNQDSPY